MVSANDLMEEQEQQRLIRNSLISLWRQLRIVDEDEDEDEVEKEEEEFLELWRDVWKKLRKIQHKNPQRWRRMRMRRLMRRRRIRSHIHDKACENERNFQKAVDMAEGFPPPKSKEDFQFLEK